MKGKFEATHAELLRLEEILKDHEPYMAIAISSTGINKRGSEFTGHQPTRVCVQEYVYSEESKEYVEGITFDRLVKCSPEALQYALNHLQEYDVFLNGGIDKDAYIRGDGVMEVDDFRKEFNRFISAAAERTRIIANNSDFCIEMLSKIDCAETFQKLRAERYILDQPTLTREFFKTHGLDARRATLEALDCVISGKDAEQSAHIVGVNRRVDVINRFIEFYGREKGYLASEMESRFQQQTNSYISDMSNAGRQKYISQDIEGKLRTLELSTKNPLSAEVLNRDYECELNRLYDFLEQPDGKSGAIVMQVATTGFGTANVPIQLSAVYCEFDENGMLTPRDAIKFDIQADGRAVQQAKDSKEKGRFDAFKYTGINMDYYFQGHQTLPNGEMSSAPLLTNEQTIARLNQFFTKHPLDQCVVITMGKSKDEMRSFSGEALSKIGNHPIVDAPFIDFAQVVKEYTYAAHFDSDYSRNAIIDESKPLASFKMEDVAEQNGMQYANSHTLVKCSTVIDMLHSIQEQHKEMLFGIEQESEQKSPLEKTKPAQTEKNGAAPISRTPTYRDPDFEGHDTGRYMTDEEMFIEEGYQNVFDAVDLAAKDNARSEQDIARREQQAFEADIIRSNIQGAFFERELFSNIRDDSIPVVTADNVQVVGAQKIRHISEAQLEEPRREQDKPKEDRQSAQPVSSGLSVDIAALVAAMTEQTKTMSAQLQVVNTQMTALMEQNGALVSAVVAQNKALSVTLENTISLLADKEQGRAQERSISAIEQLEEAKSRIAAVFDSLNNNSAREALQNANALISKGQTIIDKSEEQQKTNRPQKA